MKKPRTKTEMLIEIDGLNKKIKELNLLLAEHEKMEEKRDAEYESLDTYCDEIKVKNAYLKKMLKAISVISHGVEL